MGWWSPYIFGGDTPFDILSNLGMDLGVALPEDEGMTEPDDWTEAERAAWTAKAGGIPDWMRRCIEVDRERSGDGAVILTALLALLSGAALPSPFLERARPILVRLARRLKGRGQPSKDSLVPVFRCGDWLAEGTAHVAEVIAVAEPGVPLPRLPGAIGLWPYCGGTSAAFDLVNAALAEVGGPFLPKFSWDTDKAYIRAADDLALSLPEAAHRLLKTEPGWSDDLTIALQVAASVLMATGQPMPDDVRALAIRAGLEDPWEADEIRDMVIATYLEAVRGYRTPEPRIMRGSYLGETIERKLRGHDCAQE